MEIKLKGRILTIKHNLKENETYKIQEGKKYKSVSIYKRPMIVTGYSNATSDGKGIITGDYDGCDIEIIKEDYLSLSKLYTLPPAYIFKSSENSYHLICLKKFTQPEIYEILKHTRTDQAYKSMIFRNPYRSYVIRISPKGKKNNPKFLQIIGDKNLDEEISEAHLKFLHKLYKLPKINYTNLDMGTKVKIHTYETFI